MKDKGVNKDVMVSLSNHVHMRILSVLRQIYHGWLSNMSLRAECGKGCAAKQPRRSVISREGVASSSKPTYPSAPRNDMGFYLSFLVSKLSGCAMQANKFRYALIVLILSMFSFTTYAQNKPLKPVIAEIILPDNGVFKPFLYRSDAETKVENIMQWQNRAVIYVKTSDVARFERTINDLYFMYKVVFFEHPFYDFERKYCSDKSVAKEWTNIILSANLVKDPRMQEEYLNYHATQFQKWPEVSQGFCHADFQQLLVFKTGRQLMLVISIPKGKTLDELNPLTTKNNPRVDDWNNMMKKYQEGIEGTKADEVWVFFRDIDKK